MINVLDPDVIVLGGGLSNIEPLYGAVAALLPGRVFSDRVATRVVRTATAIRPACEAPHGSGRLESESFAAVANMSSTRLSL